MDNPLLGPGLERLRERRSVKWRAYDPDVLPLWVAEMDVVPAPAVQRAVRDAVEAGDTGYPWAPDFFEALASFAKERWDWSPSPAAMSLVPDVMLGVVEVLRLFTDPGGPVVVNSPVYPPYFQFVTSMGRRVVEAPLGPDGRLDPANLERAFGAATADGERAAYLLCSPQNPTGTVHTAAELTAAFELAERYAVRVVVDEIHAPLVPAGATFTPAVALGAGSRVVSVLSASKAFNLAGLKAAIAVAGPEAVADLRQVPEEVTHGASHLGVIAQSAAYREGGEWLDALLVGLDENRRLLETIVAQRLPDVAYRPPEATFLAWLDFTGIPELGDDPAAVLLEHGRVALHSGPAFGFGGPGHARLNFGTSPDILGEAVDRIATGIAAVRG
ncbi:MalY/PatB family protein [Knoellia koreensis]|jgi:cystathionine beta-lyase|uniref:cysteine-S-conjugate beta-lyase n=1 Tax=Knoellia koreensis TaxID=2730921 RepID=A0A849H5G2_9MICO|nr:aminotransferase class I/II-fold pyridoxal phosphate-dependent enzyme [Knoellia sp. DB2414S]NNM45020.1 aminotransferase class I/II-fold pyridoxal phosphate-dependent enzyme [Knoellia sp. DB2414S]